ncbi:hypothetical protein [Pseudomonas syringae group genomosp. 7]|uniref:hypothetical protein n=1 Tax=Pseudomonas syringae group genomosp. 7 TaxID=251699 RepID=UPI000F3D3C60|nr:hypothetical protein [Pseudomonas syringae group genomosp. 7]RMR10064.1 hypothetical protein ALP93_00597 [Pseudomonas syringae pv. helianthi]
MKCELVEGVIEMMVGKKIGHSWDSFWSAKMKAEGASRQAVGRLTQTSYLVSQHPPPQSARERLADGIADYSKWATLTAKNCS